MAVLQGTLDMLILRTLLYGPAHGHQIGKQIQRSTNDFLQMQHGSQLMVEGSQWKQMAEAVARVMWPVAEEN
jgi:PadR family transcriptional regulator PadR